MKTLFIQLFGERFLSQNCETPKGSKKVSRKRLITKEKADDLIFKNNSSKFIPKIFLP